MPNDASKPKRTPVEYPSDVEGALAVGRTLLKETGDIADNHWYQLGCGQTNFPDCQKVWDELDKLREAHFGKLGKTPPPREQRFL
jgi:hypothetical protein